MIGIIIGDPNQIFNPNNLIGPNIDKGTFINPPTTIIQDANILMPDNKILRHIFQMNLISQKNLNQLLVED